MIKENSIIIESTDDLRFLLKSYRFQLIPKTKARIIVRLKNHSIESNNRLSHIFNSYYYSCGCREGAIAMMLCVPICLFYYAQYFEPGFHIVHILIFFVLLFSSVTIGKIYGILVDRLKLTRLVHELITISGEVQEGSETSADH